MRPRILADASTGSGFLRAYIESNLAFMRGHRNYMVAIVEIARGGLTADGQRRFYGDADVDEAVKILEQHLARLQSQGELRPTSTPERWPSRSGQRSMRCRAAWRTTRPRHRQLRTRDRHHLRPGNPAEREPAAHVASTATPTARRGEAVSPALWRRSRTDPA